MTVHSWPHPLVVDFSRVVLFTSGCQAGQGEPAEATLSLDWCPHGVLLSHGFCRLPATRKGTCPKRLSPSSMTFWQRFWLTGMSHLIFTLMKPSSVLSSVSCSWSCVMKMSKTRSVGQDAQHHQYSRPSLRAMAGAFCELGILNLSYNLTSVTQRSYVKNISLVIGL